jgi:deoxycytidylate deaminase
MEAEEPHLLQSKENVPAKGEMAGPPPASLDGEIVLGLVGAVGTELEKVVAILKERLSVYRYSAEEVRISKEIIPLLVQPRATGRETEFQRITRGMDDGDLVRRASGDNGILALGAAQRISARRQKHGQRMYTPRRAYIINSLKHPAEVLKLREIYPLGFYLIGVHSDEKRRLDFLKEDRRMTSKEARILMSRDKEEVDRWGQHVTDTFHLSDFFVRLGTDSDRFKNSLWRFLDILFGDPYKTPTFDEYAMFLSFVSSLRSADLSRQVGAVISRGDEILATGANDCPKAGGGLYWPEYNDETKKIEDMQYGRDYTRGRDVNKAEQQKIIKQIVDSAEKKGIDPTALKAVLEESRIGDLTEFGRMVHAEMEALLACARNGVSTRKATLFSTTFPCHNCAKHIIAAGIERVVYIQPYEKSKAKEFHRDAISLGFAKDKNKVQFEPFVGLGPRRFLDLFSMQLGAGFALVRKNKRGRTIHWQPEKAQLRLQMFPGSYLDLEVAATKEFDKHSNKEN